MLKRLTVPMLSIGVLAVGSLLLATWASAAPTAPIDGARHALIQLAGGQGSPPARGAEAGEGAIAGPVAAVSGSAYTMAARPDGSAVTVNATSDTTYVNADGSPTEASAVKPGAFIVAEGTLSDQGKALTARRITVGEPHGGRGARITTGGTPPAHADGAYAAFGGEVSGVTGSTYTVPGPDGGSMTVNATSDTTYVNADGSSADASAVKPGAFITAEGTLSNQGKTLTARRITVGRPQGGVFLTNGR